MVASFFSMEAGIVVNPGNLHGPWRSGLYLGFEYHQRAHNVDKLYWAERLGARQK